MRDRLEDKLSMYLAVRKVLTKFNAVWSTLVAFANAVTDFDAVLVDIGDDRQVQEKDTKGVTKDKAKSKDKLIIKALEVIGALVAFATDTEDNELLEKINYTESELRNKTRDTILADKCQLVHNEANAVIGSLGDYGIAAGDLTDLQNRINDYSGRVAAPRAAIVDRAAATASLDVDFDEGDKILDKRIDKLMENFREDEEDFYKEYHQARIIIERGRRSTNLEVLVVDAETGDAIPEAECELVEHRETATTDLEGKATFETITATEDTLIVRKEGWVTQELPGTEIERGTTTEVVVELTMEAPPEIPEGPTA